ncbi:MAG: hypothetical protein GYB64_00140 [Chloroflexi bacterium]|nr:hypothetical protein [Chloroflexota bacterium]
MRRIVFLSLVLTFVLAGCQGTQPTAVNMPALPDYVAGSSHEVHQAYQYGYLNEHELIHQPCYCGCNSIGHENAYDCFVQGHDANGEPIWDNHAAGCGICIEIALDVKRLDALGWTPLEIRGFIDETYSHRGPGTDTPMPAN